MTIFGIAMTSPPGISEANRTIAGAATRPTAPQRNERLSMDGD
jgi:hypothetical protein